MNWDQVAGGWKSAKGQIKQKWAKLTDNDLDLIEGKQEELAGIVQRRYGIAKDEAEKQVIEWQQRLH